MAKVKTLPQPAIWVDPPVTKEEALNPGRWYEPPAGFQGTGSSPPSDCDLDKIVYPRDVGPSEGEAAARAYDREQQAEKFRDERLQRSRRFDITEGNLTGENPGPPSSFKEE